MEVHYSRESFSRQVRVHVCSSSMQTLVTAVLTPTLRSCTHTCTCTWLPFIFVRTSCLMYILALSSQASKSVLAAERSFNQAGTAPEQIVPVLEPPNQALGPGSKSSFLLWPRSIFFLEYPMDSAPIDNISGSPTRNFAFYQQARPHAR